MHLCQVGYLPESMCGKKTEGYIHIADWYATFCSLAGVDPVDKKLQKLTYLLLTAWICGL